jgi:hypothetical protein
MISLRLLGVNNDVYRIVSRPFLIFQSARQRRGNWRSFEEARAFVLEMIE